MDGEFAVAAAVLSERDAETVERGESAINGFAADQSKDPAAPLSFKRPDNSTGRGMSFQSKHPPSQRSWEGVLN